MRSGNKTKILALISRDLVGAEAWFHKPSYQLYTNVKEIDENNVI